MTKMQYLMIDLVVNHMGYNGNVNGMDYSRMSPFNNAGYYNPVCWINDYNNQGQVEAVSSIIAKFVPCGERLRFPVLDWQ